MLDFLLISTRLTKRGVIEIYPRFVIKRSSDLMIRGGDFYAIWVDSKGLWSTDQQEAIDLIDAELDNYYEENKGRFDSDTKVLHLWDGSTGMVDTWHHYCQKQMPDQYHQLDEVLIFSNMPANKKDFASKRLNYPLESGSISAYEKLIGTLYSPEERHKIEWAIGSIVNGDSKKLQKFLVFYGAAGTGKSTIMNIIQELFNGYYATFDAKALGSSSNSFALEAFKSNPLVGIQHDGDLSRIEDNTRINSLVSHESMSVNEKYKGLYSNSFKTFLFMGTNRPVKITDAKSGLLRRLIDVSPTGDTIPHREYDRLVKQVKFELGGIAYHCKEVYEEDPTAYDSYVPISMMGASNDFYNFVSDSFYIFKENDGVSLKAAWDLYKAYCDDAKVPYPLSRMIFKEELKNYFRDFVERKTLEDGSRVRQYYEGFRREKFEPVQKVEEKPPDNAIDILKLSETVSLFDETARDYPAQYANENGTPLLPWDKVKTTLKDLDTSRLHYVMVPLWHIVIDFDLKNEKGEKSREENLRAASKFPPTYAEYSKSGAGVHLHYLYSGDVKALSRIYDEGIEVKIFTGNSSLRRQLTFCNNLPIATISTGLPLKEECKTISGKMLKTEKALRAQIERNLNKEIWANTAPSVSLIFQILEDAYNSDLKYDVSDMYDIVEAFASTSTHQAKKCLDMVRKMHFKSEDAEAVEPPKKEISDSPLIFFDVEVFINLFLICWKYEHSPTVVRMFNPTPVEVAELCKNRLVNFNGRKYDNHILYGRMLGYSNEQLYELSQAIISNATVGFSNAYNLSYTDIFDFSSDKKSLKKFEIELDIHHKELGMPWDKPVPEDKWELVAQYCDNDVIATEALFHSKARQQDFIAREILADVAGLTVNDTTNTLTTRIIFGKERRPYKDFMYRDLSKPVYELPDDAMIFLKEHFPEMMAEPHGEAKSLLPYFPGYTYQNRKSIYKGQEVGEGGRVWAKPGMYGRTITFDVRSMHPHSALAEYLFGPYTQLFFDLVNARVAIKEGNYEAAKKMFGGKLARYLDDPSGAKALSGALKIAINSVYGLTAAKFENAFHDPRNIDNIVAKRGALFMTDLKEEVEKRGGEVIHIKTDSIKIVNPSDDICNFVMEFGKRYGYTFEIEHIFEKICLVNNAVYIGKLAEDDPDDPGQWTATGTQFAVPYVFKKLFSKEDIVFKDLCEVKEVKSAIHLDFNEGMPDGEHNLSFVGKVGLFCPIKEGCNGGLLVREAVNKKTGETKYDSVTGTQGYRWMESEDVEALNLKESIDRSYYDNLVNEAVESISEFGDFEWFVA